MHTIGRQFNSAKFTYLFQTNGSYKPKAENGGENKINQVKQNKLSSMGVQTCTLPSFFSS